MFTKYFLMLSGVFLAAGIFVSKPVHAETLMFNSFENKSDLMGIRANSAKMTLVPDYATEGRQALKVDFYKAQWPNVTFAPKKPLDWRRSGNLAMDVTNPGNETLQFSVRVDDDPKADGINHCRTGSGSIEPGKTATFTMSLGIDPMSVGMRGLPSNNAGRELGANGSGPFDTGHIVAFQIFMSSPNSIKTLIVDNIRLVTGSSLDKIVDEFGQYAKADWPGKIHNANEFKANLKAEEAAIKAQPAMADRDKFGGWSKGPKLKSTGFFRTEKVGGKWWFVDPDGYLFFSLGIDDISLGGDQTIIDGREYMFSWLPGDDSPLARHYGYVNQLHSGPVTEGRTFNFLEANLDRKYGAGYEQKWAESVLKRLPYWGFNTIANWSDQRFYGNKKLPYVATGGIGGDHARVSSGSDYWGQMHDPFDPQFAKDVASSLKPLASKVKNDPWCIGYFIDNELSWGGDGDDRQHYGLALGALAMDSGISPAKAAFFNKLKAKYKDIDALNAAWKTKLPDWETLGRPYAHEKTFTAEMKKDLSDFLRDFARKYFSVIKNELKRLDPQHLYMGCRFAWKSPEAVESAAEICDVVSFNVYSPRVDEGSWGYLTQLNKPCIIGEFHFGALDRGMFHTGLVAVSDQKARAAMYIDYVQSVLDNPAFIGCHWFRYSDEPLTGRYYDGENYNIGFISVADNPYPEMVEAARKVHSEAYTRRYGEEHKR